VTPITAAEAGVADAVPGVGEMALRKSLLVVDAGGESLEPVARRLAGMGFQVLRAKTARDAQELARDPRFLVGAVVVPQDLPALDLAGSLRALRGSGPQGELPVLACGMRPDASQRERLRRAGAAHALWFPLDDHLLRFQANRALAGGIPVRVARSAERVPTNWPVQLRSGGRERPAKVYSISARGAFLATQATAHPKMLLHLALPLQAEDMRVAAEVVMTNVPGNLAKGNLPVGMGVRFRALDDNAEAALLAFTLARRELLQV
jgi:CheY-like chemotaxis protein